MNTTDTVLRHFWMRGERPDDRETGTIEPMVEDLTGERGYLATLPNGIARWATTPERAVEIARRQTEMYERDGILQDVMRQLGTA